jgi:hypothetical protein
MGLKEVLLRKIEREGCALALGTIYLDLPAVCLSDTKRIWGHIPQRGVNGFLSIISLL